MKANAPGFADAYRTYDVVARRVPAYGYAYPFVELLLGAAYVAGFGWGLARDYDVVVEMDADGSHQPEQLHLLLEALEHADLVIGSRYMAGGSIPNWPLHRRVLSVGANTYARLALGIPVRDATAGYRVYRAAALGSMDTDAVASQGYCFQVDLTLEPYSVSPSWSAPLRGTRASSHPCAPNPFSISEICG